MGALLLAGFFSVLIGVILGLLGGGGGVLAVPILVYVVGVAAKSAIATSLFFVGSTSSIGTVLAARGRRVRWKLGATFGAASMTGAFLGGRLAQFVPERVLLGGLAAIMLVTALAMLRERKESTASDRPIAVGRMLVIGAAVGVVSGLVGAGGGFLIVPALVLFGGLAMREAIGTSLFVIFVQSFAGFAGHVSHVELDWRLLAIMTGAGIFGMYVGSKLGERVPVKALKLGFAAMVFLTGSFVLVRELSIHSSLPIILAALAVAIFVVRQRVRSSRSTEKECITSARIQL